jgi:hypothetical protein
VFAFRHWHPCNSKMAVNRIKAHLLITLAALVASAGSGKAQTLHVKFTNGSNGKPAANAYVNAWVGDQRKDATPIMDDANGNATLRLTNDEMGRSDSGPLGPTLFSRASEIRIRIGFVLCQSSEQKNSRLRITSYATEEWTRTGIVTPNTCGKTVVKSQPEELTIFARPLTLWKKPSQ